MKYLLLILLFLVKCQTTFGQTLIFSKSKQEHRIYINQSLKFTLINGEEYKGQVFSVATNSIIIKTKENKDIIIYCKEIKSYSQRKHLWYLGARLKSIITYNAKHNVEGYKCNLVNNKST